MFAVMFAFMPLLRQSSTPFKKTLAPTIVLFACAVFLAINFTPAFKVKNITSVEADKFHKPR